MPLPDQPTLTLLSGPQAGQTFSLYEGAQTVGRTSENSIMIADPSISRQHARLTVGPGQVVVEDLGSSNGTYINGRRIQQPVPLKPGDMLRLGLNVELRFGPAAGPVEELGPTYIPAEIIAAPAPSPFGLLLEAGPQPGHIFQLPLGQQLLGRSPDCSLYIPDATLSKQHARLVVQPDGLWIEDLNSSNGTFVNGQRIVSRVQLQAGDRLQVGTNVVLQVHGPGGIVRAIPLAQTPVAAGRPGSKMGVIVAVLAVVLLAAGGLVAFLLLPAEENQAEATGEPTATPTPTETPPPAVVMSFSSDKNSVKLGECATLRWQVESAREVRLDGEVVPNEGNRKACPQEPSKIYRLTALSQAGETQEQTVALTVPATSVPPPGVEIEFAADRSSVPFGECATLRWQVSNVQSVRLDSEKVGASGSQQVCPTDSATTYRLLVQPLEGELIEQAIILNVPATPTPTPPPTVTPSPTTAPKPLAQNPVIDQFMADQYQLNPGACTTLRWNTRNAGIVRIDGNQVANSGSMQVCPKAGNNTYNIVATSSGGGSVQSSVQLTVNQPTATPAPLNPYAPPAIVPVPAAPVYGPPIINVCATYEGNACYYFWWNIQNVREIYFDGKGVTSPGSKRICGDDDDEPGEKGNLRIIHQDGRVETINAWPPCN